MSLLVLLLGLTATGLILLRFELGQMPKRKRKQGPCLYCALCLTLPMQTLLQLPFPESACPFPANLVCLFPAKFVSSFPAKSSPQSRPVFMPCLDD